MDNKELKLSVIVPVYNVEKYLKECVDSLLSQTRMPDEIILVDDGSIDSSGTICDEYAGKNEFIKVIHKKNGGLSSARNAAIDIVLGNVLSFVDSDDWVEPRMFEILLNNMSKYDADMSECGFCNQYEGHHVIKSTEVPSQYEIEIFHGKDVLKAFHADFSAWNKIYRSSLFKDIRYPVGKLYEDARTTYKLAYLAKTATRIKLPLYNYRHRAQSIMTSFTTNNYLDRVNVWNEIYDFLEDKFDSKELKIVRKRKYKLVIELIKTIIANHQIKAQRSVLKELICELNDWHVFMSGFNMGERIIGILGKTVL